MTEKYYPEPVPYTDDLPYIREFLFREFLRISASFEGVREIELEELSVEPTARAGMIKYADGVNWDPGDGEGIYAYVGGAWIKLSLTLGGTITQPIIIDYNGDITSASSTNHALQLGATAGLNVAFDTNEVQTRNNGVATTWLINAFGGDISFGGTGLDQQLILNAGQLQFPVAHNPSTNARVMDDYEEGTWTPALTFGGASTGITYLSQDGSYVKIGQLVHIFLRIRLTSKGTAVGTANITGCPFIANNDITNGVYDTGIAAYYTGMAGMASHPAGYINRGSSLIVLTHAGPTARTNMTEANFTDATDILMSITYRADA